ncbi:hypothetical protein LI328DRAFT_74538 [Trichoderma asperelloides]|nr:hypothetical protein LI328DRAFT_74538 [Trichoderma asperelloides]
MGWYGVNGYVYFMFNILQTPFWLIILATHILTLIYAGPNPYDTAISDDCSFPSRGNYTCNALMCLELNIYNYRPGTEAILVHVHIWACL